MGKVIPPVPDSEQLVIVSNRGPAEFERDEAGERVVRRGGGGLVTALQGLVSHRDALWIASAMTDEDVAVTREADGRADIRRARRGRLRGAPGRVRRRGVRALLQRHREPDPVVHPALPVGPLERAGHPRRARRRPGTTATGSSTTTSPRRCCEPIEGNDEPLVMLHDYHLYTCPALIREARPDAFLQHFVHIPWSQPDSLADPPRAVARGDLPGDARQRHHRLPHQRLLPQLPALLPRADGARGGLRARRGAALGPRDLGARLSAGDRRRALRAGRRLGGGRSTTRRSCCAAAATT